MARSSIGKCIRTLLLNRIGNCCWSIWDLTPRLASSSPTLGVYVILALGIFDLGLETLVGESLPLAATACAATPSSGRFPATPSTFNPAFSPSSFACSRPWQSPQIEALQRCQAAFLSHLPVIAQALEATLPPQPPRLASLREWQARRFHRPPWAAPLLEELRRCLPAFPRGSCCTHPSATLISLSLEKDFTSGSPACFLASASIPSFDEDAFPAKFGCPSPTTKPNTSLMS